jgi:glycosyltransferase involved in cell wall biosynthesis
MNILVSGQAMSYLSGQPLYCYELCLELKRRGHRVTMVSEYVDNLHGADGHKLKENLETAGVKLVPIKTLEGLEPNYDLAIVSETCSEAVINRLPDTPVINVVHSEYVYETPLEDRPQIIAYVCIRHNILEHIVNEHNIPRDKCVVIYNGVDRERFKKVKKNKRSYEQVVVPCTLDTLREKFLNEVISTASPERHIDIFGFDCGAKLQESPYVTIHPDKFNIEKTSNKQMK